MGLLLPLALLLAAPSPGGSGGLCPLLCRCRGRLLGCSFAGLARLPPGPRLRGLSLLDFTGNSISSIEKAAWREYPWAEYLFFPANNLREVRRHSLEGLLLLKHLDLSCNKILSIEEHAFEPLPFLQLINLDGNLITQLQNGTFQAWHGLQFLQKLILSHNPLSVIADTSFFKLPSVKYLDLGGTQVTQQMLLTLLLTTTSLETLKLPSDVACCFCQEDTTETLCRTIQFHCGTLCSTTAPVCAGTDPLPRRQGALMAVVQPRKLNASVVLSLTPKEPLLGDHKTLMLEVVLSQTSTDGDPRDHISRTNSPSPQRLSRQEGKTANTLMAELEKKLPQAKSVTAVEKPNTVLPASATQKAQVQEIPGVQGKRTTGWVQKQHGSGFNPTDNLLVFWHHKTSPAPKSSLSHSSAEAPHLSRIFKIQSYSDTVKQTKKTHGMEDEEDVKDAEEAPARGQDYLRTSKQGHNPSLNNRHQIFYQTFGNVNPEEEPTPTESKAEQRVNPAQQFGYNLLVNSSPPASSMQEDRAVPPTTATNWKPQGEGFSFHNQPVSSDRVLGQGELIESQVDAHLHPLVPDEALRTFLAGMARALQVDCRLPQLQLPCTKLLSRTEQLIKLLSEKQNNQGASALTNQCLLGGNFSMGVARDMGGKAAEERNPEHTSSDKLLLAMLVSFIIMVNLMGICLIEVCSQARAAASQPQSHSKSPPRWFFHKLPLWKQSKEQTEAAEQGGWDQSRACPPWLRQLQEPLDSQQEQSLAELYDGEVSEEEEEEEGKEEEEEEEEEIFSKP